MCHKEFRSSRNILLAVDRELCVDRGCRDLLVGQQTANTFSSDCANIKPLIWINVDSYRSLESISLVSEKAVWYQDHIGKW